MRCAACNCNLSNRESTRKSAITGQYLDLCDSCMVDTDITYVDSLNFKDEEPEELE